jgi:hypothetical protein
MLFSGFQLNTVTLGTQRRSVHILLIFGDGEGSGEWGSVGVGVVASLVRNDCSFPAERACLAPAFRHKIFGKRES